MKVAKKKRATTPPLTVVAPSDAVQSAAVDLNGVDTSKASDGGVASATAAAASVSSEPVVTLDSNCTVKDAVALKHALCAVVATPAPVTLDVRAVERIDTATVQVLCAFVRERIAAAHSIHWIGVPQVLREAAQLLGVQSLLSLPPAEAAS